MLVQRYITVIYKIILTVLTWPIKHNPVYKFNLLKIRFKHIGLYYPRHQNYIVIFTLSLLTLTGFVYGEQNCFPCTCDANYILINCNGLNLVKLPTDLPFISLDQIIMARENAISFLNNYTHHDISAIEDCGCQHSDWWDMYRYPRCFNRHCDMYCNVNTIGVWSMSWKERYICTRSLCLFDFQLKTCKNGTL